MGGGTTLIRHAAARRRAAQKAMKLWHSDAGYKPTRAKGAQFREEPFYEPEPMPEPRKKPAPA